MQQALLCSEKEPWNEGFLCAQFRWRFEDSDTFYGRVFLWTLRLINIIQQTFISRNNRLIVVNGILKLFFYLNYYSSAYFSCLIQELSSFNYTFFNWVSTLCQLFFPSFLNPPILFNFLSISFQLVKWSPSSTVTSNHQGTVWLVNPSTSFLCRHFACFHCHLTCVLDFALTSRDKLRKLVWQSQKN